MKVKYKGIWYTDIYVFANGSLLLKDTGLAIAPDEAEIVYFDDEGKYVVTKKNGTGIVAKELEENQDLKFPCLMESTLNGTVILANRGSLSCIHGTVVKPGSDKDVIGKYSTYWDKSVFIPFGGKITLSNND